MNYLKYSNSNSINILIPNATSPRNIGDQAILEGLINLLKNGYKNARIKIHGVDPNIHGRQANYQVDHNLYSWSILKNKGNFLRMINLIKLLLQYMILRLGIEGFSKDKQMNNLIKDYKNADLIVFVGGGYLRSRRGITQSLNLIMQLSHFVFAQLFSGKKIVAPVSVGPFGHKWHERIVVSILRNLDIVAAREDISYKGLKKHKMKNIVLSSDHAFNLKKMNKKKVSRDFTLGFTVREWLNGEQYRNFEKSFVDSIRKFSKLTGAKIQPIIQVDAPMYGEDDAKVTKKIVGMLEDNDIEIMKIKKLNNVNDALNVYSDIDLLLGMRMHSNILAAVQGTPFVAISYEYKTEGIAKQLSMDKYSIKCEEVDEINLYKLLINAYKNRISVRTSLVNSVKKIQAKEMKRWERIL